MRIVRRQRKTWYITRTMRQTVTSGAQTRRKTYTLKKSISFPKIYVHLFGLKMPMLDVTRFLLIHYFVLFQQDELFRVPAQAYCSATEREKLESEKEANSEERLKKSFWWIPCCSKQRALDEAFSALQVWHCDNLPIKSTMILFFHFAF